MKGIIQRGLLAVFVACACFCVINTQDTEETQIKAAGANDVALETVIQDSLNASDRISVWQKFLNDTYRKTSASFTWATPSLSLWSGNTSNIAPDAANIAKDTAMVQPEKIDGFYEIYYPEQLSYVLTSTVVTDKSLKLMADLDLNGSAYEWINTVSFKNATFDGNGKTIYNIGAKQSFIEEVENVTFENVTFDSAKIAASDKLYLGIVGNIKTGNFNYVRVQNSLMFSSFPEYNAPANKASYIAPFGHSKNLTAEHIATVNNTIYAQMAHDGGAFGAIEVATIKNSYSVDSTVIAGGNHSGGFISCGNGGNSVESSFTNNTVLGYKETGVFIGSLVNNAMNMPDKFVNCFTSGSIEGVEKLGGFVGEIETAYDRTYNATFENCYSTSIVGMQKGGIKLGGFIGAAEKAITTNHVFKNCFATGEVGSIDTDTSSGRGASTVGGFIGSYANINGLTFENCFYDKQTSAMREWEAGKSRDSLGTGADGGFDNILGIKGVLTSDAKKFGAGLASQPKEAVDGFVNTTGFTGFEGDVRNTSVIVTNPNWVYDGGNLDPTLHNCMYPQLSVFFNSNDAFVRAFSYASVATIHEQVWDTCTHGQDLPKTTYDTVRDLTMRFTLTSYVENPKEDELGANVAITWKKSDAESNLYGLKKPVIGLFMQTENSKYNRPYWTADKFAPGTEWAKVEFKITQDGKSVIGSRRMRIIPTSNITPGVDQIDLVTTNKYNHAKDVLLAYSTAPRLAANASDITTGVYPDVLPFEAGDARASIQSIDRNIQDQFALDAKNFSVGGEHLTNAVREVGTAHPNNIVNVYMYGVKSFQEASGGSDAKIIYGTKEDALLSPDILDGKKGEEKKISAQKWAKKLTGDVGFEKEDVGRYMIEYEWILPDGRYMRDSKMLMIQSGEHTVASEVRNTGDNTLNNSSLMLSLNTFNYTSARPTPSFDKTSSKAEVDASHGEPVDIAFKAKNVDTTIDKIVFKFKTGDISSSGNEQEVVINNVLEGQPFDVPVSYYYTSYEENGNYYAKKVATIKQYTLNKDASGYFYLTLNQTFNDATTGLERFDTECDVKATIYITDAKAKDTATAKVSTKTLENDKQVFTNKTFDYHILDQSGIAVETFSTTSLKDEVKSITLPVGSYTIEQLSDNGYALKSVIIDGNTITAKPFAFTLTTDGVVNIAITNEKKTEKPLDPTKPTDPITPINPDKDTTGQGGSTTGDTQVFPTLYIALLVTSLLLIGCVYYKIRLARKEKK